MVRPGGRGRRPPASRALRVSRLGLPAFPAFSVGLKPRVCPHVHARNHPEVPLLLTGGSRSKRSRLAISSLGRELALGRAQLPTSKPSLHS